jgi:hypothetical protein
MEFAVEKKSYVTAQVLETRRLFERSRSSTHHSATTTEAALTNFESRWRSPLDRFNCIPGKDALSAFNRHLQDRYSVSVTPTSVIEAMSLAEIPSEIRELVQVLSSFEGLNASN